MDFVSQTTETGPADNSRTAAPDEVELTRRIRGGDSVAEAEMIHRLQPGIRMLLGRRLGSDWALIDDLAQETLLIVLKRLRGAGLEDPSALANFAARTARN